MIWNENVKLFQRLEKIEIMSTATKWENIVTSLELLCRCELKRREADRSMLGKRKPIEWQKAPKRCWRWIQNEEHPTRARNDSKKRLDWVRRVWRKVESFVGSLSGSLKGCRGAADGGWEVEDKGEGLHRCVIEMKCELCCRGGSLLHQWWSP